MTLCNSSGLEKGQALFRDKGSNDLEMYLAEAMVTSNGLNEMPFHYKMFWRIIYPQLVQSHSLRSHVDKLTM
jgi:hypothetical protein